MSSLSKKLDSIQKQLDEVRNKIKSKEKFYLKINNPEVAIGDGVIHIFIVDSEGKEIETNYLLGIKKNGTLARYGGVEDVDVLSLNEMGQIKLGI